MAAAESEWIITTVGGHRRAGLCRRWWPGSAGAAEQSVRPRVRRRRQSVLLRYVQSLHPARRWRAPRSITTIAGTGERGFAGDGGEAMLRLAERALRRGGGPGRHDLFRRPLEPPRAADRTARVSSPRWPATVPGKFSGDGGPAADAGLVEPNGLALDASRRTIVHRRRRRSSGARRRSGQRHHQHVRRHRRGAARRRWRAGDARGRLRRAGRGAGAGRRAVHPRTPGQQPAHACATASSRPWPAPARAATPATAAMHAHAVFNAPKEMAVDARRQRLHRRYREPCDPLHRRAELDRHHDRRQWHRGTRRRWRAGACRRGSRGRMARRSARTARSISATARTTASAS